MTLFYHATTSEAAHSIGQTQQFRPGQRPDECYYAGAGMYFSLDPETAVRHCRNGDPDKAEVVICCTVDLGKCLIAARYEVCKDECFARGYDSVTAILASPTRSLIDLGALYSKYPSLRQAVHDVGSLKEFCNAHAELSIDGHCVTIADATPLMAVQILLVAIQASPKRSFNVSSKMHELYSKHPRLRQAIEDAGGLRKFCEAHADLTMDGNFLTMTKARLPAKQTRASALQQLAAQPHSQSQAVQPEKRLPLALETLLQPQAAQQHSQSQAVKPERHQPLALAALVAAIRASSTGSLNVTSHIDQLCLKHPHLHKALCAAGGLRSFCEAHPELAMHSDRVSLSTQSAQPRKPQIEQEKEAQQMHAMTRCRAEEQQRHMQTQIKLKQKQEVARQLELQGEAIARQREAEHRRQMRLKREEEYRQAWLHQKECTQMKAKETIDRRYACSCAECKNKQIQSQQDAASFHQSQLQLKQEEKARQLMREASQRLQRERDTHRQWQLQSTEVSPWAACSTIIFGGVSAGIRWLLGM